MNKPPSNPPPKRSARKRNTPRTLVYWAVGLLLFYTIAGFFILPPIVRSVAVKQLSKQLGRDVSIQQVKLNPFALSATIRGLLIKEKNGDPFVSWDEVYANLQLASFFGHPWVIKEVRTSQPFIHVQINGDDTFNFSDILAKFSTKAPPKAPTGPAKQLAVRVDRIEVSGATLSLKRDEPLTHSDVVSVAAPKAPETTNTTESILLLLQSVTNGFATFSHITNSFAATIGTLCLSNCTVHLEDLANPRPARLTLDRILVNATNLSNLPLTNFTTALSLRWNTNGTLHSEINASLAPPSADIHLAFANLELHPLDPYLDSKLSVFIIGSKLGMDGQIRLRAPKGSLPDVTFAGDTWLNDFNTVDGVLDEPLLKWDSVHISGISAALNPPVVTIKKIAVSDAYARLIIETNRTINLLAALRMSSTNAEPETPAAQPKEAKGKKSLLAGDTVISTNALAELPLKKFSIDSIVITNASANFTDRSITPNVNMSVQQINGDIAGISSEEWQHADVSLHAKVDNVGPVDITGAINPFSKDQTNEIKIAVNNVDLTAASPYAGKFAGYRIAKGKLSVALSYHLHGRSLKSENVITLDQFTFGEKVNSPDATKLPVRLGIAVLKDRSGKIVLDVPIDGSLDDPQFRLHKVIMRALWNVVEKAITSPFAVLGAMFGGKGQELSYQDFTPGSADLTPATREKLDVMIKALYERPGLQMEISGSVDTNADIAGLRARYLEKELRAEKWRALRKADQEATTPDQVVVTPEERPELLRTLYADALAKGLIVTSSNTPTAAIAATQLPVFKKTAERGASQLMAKEAAPAVEAQPAGAVSAAGTDPMELALLNSVPVTDDDFQALATERAKAVREYILQSGKVEPARLFLTENKTGNLKTEGPRVYLELQ
jgi:outer membrane protein OmpA-like peptidoglycan-associated protein